MPLWVMVILIRFFHSEGKKMGLFDILCDMLQADYNRPFCRRKGARTVVRSEHFYTTRKLKEPKMVGKRNPIEWSYHNLYLQVVTIIPHSHCCVKKNRP